jgi:hypothetical protein
MSKNVSLKVAKLLQEYNFDLICNKGYVSDDNGGYYLSDSNKILPAPTIDEVTEWLRDKHKLLISIKLGDGAKPRQYEVTIQDINGSKNVYLHKTHFYYESACEAGIEYSLKYLIQKFKVGDIIIDNNGNEYEVSDICEDNYIVNPRKIGIRMINQSDLKLSKSAFLVEKGLSYLCIQNDPPAFTRGSTYIASDNNTLIDNHGNANNFNSVSKKVFDEHFVLVNN